MRKGKFIQRMSWQGLIQINEFYPIPHGIANAMLGADMRLRFPRVFERQPPLDKYDGLTTRDFESAPTAWVLADQEIVGPHEIVTGLGKLRAVDIAGPCRDLVLLFSPQPANLELG
jgi:hypothetical protein